jgi:hypothetical protein
VHWKDEHLKKLISKELARKEPNPLILDYYTGKITYEDYLTSDHWKNTKTEVNTLISNTNSSVDTKLLSYYNKTEVDNKLATLDLTNYALKSTVYTKSETNALFTPYYTKTNVDDKFVLYYTKSNVDSLFANDRLSNDGRYVLKNDYDTYTSTIYTKTEVDNKVSNINTQITGLTTNLNTLNTTVGNNYTDLDNKYVTLNTKVENYNSTQNTNLNAYKTLANGKISTLETNVTNITTNLNDNYYNKTQIDTKLGAVNKIETTVGTTADTNYNADYAGKFNLRSQDDGSLLLNIGATEVTATNTTYNSIKNIQIKTDVMGKTYIRKYSKANNVTGFNNWEKIITSTDPTYNALDTRYDIATKTGLYGDHLHGLRANMNINNWEMWFSTHNMAASSLTYTDVTFESPEGSITVYGLMRMTIPIPTWWKFNKLIDIKVECYDMELSARIDPKFYTDTLIPIYAETTDSEGTQFIPVNDKLTILLTDVAAQVGNWAVDYGMSFTAFKTGRRVPKIKITGIGKPSGTLTTTYNGFTAI